MSVSSIVTHKGRQEILDLIGSNLVSDWAETDHALKNVVRMLLVYRPDLVRNYFFPEAWAQLAALEKPQQGRIVLAALKAVVIEECGAPPVSGWTQALFYMNTREPRFTAMAEEWAAANPQRCKYPLKAKGMAPLRLPGNTTGKSDAG